MSGNQHCEGQALSMGPWGAGTGRQGETVGSITHLKALTLQVKEFI